MKKNQNKGNFISINSLMLSVSLEEREGRSTHCEYCENSTWKCRKALYNKIKAIFLFSPSVEQKLLVIIAKYQRSQEQNQSSFVGHVGTSGFIGLCSFLTQLPTHKSHCIQASCHSKQGLHSLQRNFKSLLPPICYLNPP